MKTEYVNLFVLFAAITAPIITILTGTLLSITSIGDWLFRKIENKKLKTLKIFAQVCSVVSVFSTIVLIILGVLAFVNTPQIVYPLIVSVATADELTCFIISLALLIAVIIGFTAIEVMRDWINSKNLSAGEKDSLYNFSKELSFYAKTAIGFGFVILIGINPIIGFVVMTLAAIVLRASDVLLECSHYTFEQCMDMNQDIY